MHWRVIFRNTFSRCLSWISSVRPWRWLWLLLLIPIVTGLATLALREKQYVWSVTVSPNGRTLAISKGVAASFVQRGTLELWDLQTGRFVVAELEPAMAGSQAFSPDSHTLAV